jgi:hypothetical protein
MDAFVASSTFTLRNRCGIGILSEEIDSIEYDLTGAVS